MKLKIHKADSSIVTPAYQTENSACFDLVVFMPHTDPVKAWFGKDVQMLTPQHDGERGEWYITLMPHERALIRTGLIFDIPKGHSIRLYSRSGMASKYGIVVAQGEGIIDEDYVNETMIVLLNTTPEAVRIYDNERVAQAEIVSYMQCSFEEISEKPDQKTDRAGGFGSTGRS